MTSNAVTNVKNLFTGNAGKASLQSNSSDDSFGILMSQQVSAQDDKTAYQDVKDYSKKSETVKPSQEKSDSPAKAESKEQIQSKDSRPKEVKTESKDSSDCDIPDEMKNAFEEAKEQIVAAILDNFQITEEELSQIMAVLGIEMFDLLQNSNLGQLVAALGGAQDQLSIITDAELYQTFKTLSEALSGIQTELTNECSLAPEELAQMLKEYQEDLKLTVNTEELPKEIQSEIPVDTEENISGNADDAEVVLPQKTDSETKTFGEELEAKVVEAKVEKEPSASKQNMNSGADSQSKEGMMNFSNTQTATVVNENGVQAVTYTEHFDGANIVKQLVQQIKISVTPETTSMDMQLNPENLGKIHLHIASREGVITAQITAQNEFVKEALESQVAQLRDNLNNQGVKVEAVEVTVSAHEFDRNLEQNAQHNRENADEQEKQSKRRILDLNRIDESEEELTEIEIQEAKIRRAHGNNVDYSA